MDGIRTLGVWAERGLAAVEDWAMAALLAAAACLGLFQIVLRYIFAIGFDWVEAYLIVFVVYAAFIGASVAVRRHIHVRLEVVVDRLPERSRWVAYLVNHALCLFYTAALWLFGLQFTLQVMSFGQVNILSDLPEWVHYVCVPLGMTLMTIRYLQEMWRLVRAGPGFADREGARAP